MHSAFSFITTVHQNSSSIQYEEMLVRTVNHKEKIDFMSFMMKPACKFKICR